ncbi:MAG: type II toxin-antitoxin system VapC family toxin [Gammaproteobacteria bacterium]
MKYVVDTCGWIEWLTEGKLCSEFYKYLKHPQHLLIPTIVQYELYKWITKNRDENLALQIIAVTEQSEVISLDQTHTLLAADVALSRRLAMADAIVYATALQSNATLVTCDSHFSELPKILYIKK